jgi:hypothetical protein
MTLIKERSGKRQILPRRRGEKEDCQKRKLKSKLIGPVIVKVEFTNGFKLHDESLNCCKTIVFVG